MAASTSFKQQCPSCEAMVPIRDPNLIGRKIDCPKCKYRFVVEDPGTAEEEDEPKSKGKRDASDKNGAKSKPGARRRDEDDEDDGKPAKSGGNNKLILGVGLAVVAVGLLIAVGWLMFGGGGSSSTSSPAKSGGPSLGQATQPADAPKEDDKDKKETGAAAAGSSMNADALTNLMPPETEGVCLVHMQDLRKNALGRVMFESAGSFNNAALQTRLGFSVDDVDVVLQAWNFTQNWTLSVIHTKSAINVENVKAVLQAKPVDEKDRPDGQEYFILDNNPWLDMLGHSAFAMLLQTNPALLPPRSGPRALRVVDDQTLIVADLKPMQLFLSKKGAFDRKSPDAATTAAAEKEKPQSAEEGGPGNMRGMMGRGGMGQGMGQGGMGMGMGGMGQGGQPKAEEAPAGPSGAYLTINPALKTMLDRVEAKQPVISLAFDTAAAGKGRVPVLGINLLRRGSDQFSYLKTVFEEANVIGAAAQFKDGITLTLGASYGSDDEHDKRLKSMQSQEGPELAKLLTTAMETEVEYTDEDPNALAMNGGEGGMMGMGMGRGMGMGMGQGGITSGLTQSRPSMGGGGANSGPPAGMTMGGQGGGRGGRQGGGLAGGDIGEGQFGMGLGGGRGGMRMGGMGMTGQQQDQTKSDKPTSTVRVTSPDKALVLVIVHFIDKKANDKFINRRLRQLVLQQKGNLDMAGGQLMLHKLGDAVFSYPKGKDHLGIFPRAARHREIASLREGRPYPPNDRLSWMVELLPYLGPEQQDLYNQIDKEKSWRHEDNLPLASTLVPHFLDPQTSASSWYVRVPGTDEVAATTQFVGIAGVGLDAASYPDSDPAIEKKLGIFGYDRQTRLADVTDKTSHTVLLIEVPPTYKRPWMSGGGSTVMGVPETGSIRPFVSTTRDGKKGTYALMADGSVRWISENISDDAFKALCTAKGGETVLLNREAPEVPRPEGQAEIKVVTAPPPQAARPKNLSISAQSSVSLPAGWKTFTSNEAGFSIGLPGTPQAQSMKVPTPAGEVEAHVFVCQMRDGGSCVVAYTDIPVKLPDQLGDDFWAGVRGPIAAQGTIVSEKKVSLGSFPGREHLLDVAGKGQIRSRIYQVRQRSYSLTLPLSNIKPEEEKAFFESFTLLTNDSRTQGGSDRQDQGQANSTDKVVAVMTKHCAMCHTGQKAKGRYQLFTGPGAFNRNAPKDKLAEVLESGKMPPPPRPRPSAQDFAVLQEWVKQ